MENKLFINNNSGGSRLEDEIKKNGVLYFLRATPFTEYGRYSYNGMLKEEFFFDNLFSRQGKCDEYINQIINQVLNKNKNSIVLIGNQGCGKTTFVHHLSNEFKNNVIFNILDFDKDTSNPKLEDYIEIFSSYLHNVIRNDFRKNSNKVNMLFNNLYLANKGLILNKINGANKIKLFFDEFKKVFIDKDFSDNDCSNFINNINALFFNQILSLIVLWHISEFSAQSKITPMIFCLDNLDVLVNSDIITGFFEEYYCFLRNIDAIIQNLKSKYINNTTLEYDKIFTFIFCCRQHTWAKVKKTHLHQGNIISLSTFERNITDAFDKNAILAQREAYIKREKNFYCNFSNELSEVKALLEDMNEWNNIYDLFNDDYRQCSITFEKLLEETPDLLENYVQLKKEMASKPLYGARGLIYKSLFDLFKNENLFDLIGVLDINSAEPAVSDARIILNYLDYHTFDNNKKSISYEQIVRDFKGIVSEERLNYSLIQMFNLGIEDSFWNELIAFVQIDTDDLETCNGTKIFITKAGHEYLDLLSTHFEFFNVRVTAKRKTDAALYSNISMKEYTGHKNYKYNFEETIQNVIDVVENCCKKMSKFYNEIMFKKFDGKENYLNSEFVYKNNNTKVFHGERIIHTHIRYIDQFRLFILKNRVQNDENNKINEILVGYIKKYIQIGRTNPNVLSAMSDELFIEFDDKIKNITNSGYTDYKTAINVNIG